MIYSTGQILFKKYSIEKLVGSGAFAEVYQARHLELNDIRALKILRCDAAGLGSQDFKARISFNSRCLAW
jgi:hypothetical protein